MTTDATRLSRKRRQLLTAVTKATVFAGSQESEIPTGSALRRAPGSAKVLAIWAHAMAELDVNREQIVFVVERDELVEIHVPLWVIAHQPAAYTLYAGVRIEEPGHPA